MNIEQAWTSTIEAIGLKVSYGIIEQHHGSIKITSKLKKGTTVIIKLPV